MIVSALTSSDVVAFAQCAALDATVFPYPSIPGLETAPVLWIARLGRGGEVLGFVAGARGGRVMEIVGLAVREDARRHGIGRALLKAAILGARARRCIAVELHVSTSNRPAVELYRSEGFESVLRLDQFYRRGVFGTGDAGSAWAMRLRLQSPPGVHPQR